MSRAEQNEERVGKAEIGLDTPTYNALDESLKKKFSWDATARCYVARGLTWRKLEAEKMAKAIAVGTLIVAAAAAGTTIATAVRAGTTKVTPGKKWGPGPR